MDRALFETIIGYSTGAPASLMRLLKLAKPLHREMPVVRFQSVCLHTDRRSRAGGDGRTAPEQYYPGRHPERNSATGRLYLGGVNATTSGRLLRLVSSWLQCLCSSRKEDIGNDGTYSQCVIDVYPGMHTWFNVEYMAIRGFQDPLRFCDRGERAASINKAGCNPHRVQGLDIGGQLQCLENPWGLL